MPARRRPRAARGRARPRQDDAGAHARRGARPELLAHPVHARPDAGRHRRHQRHRRGRARRQALRVPARARSSRNIVLADEINRATPKTQSRAARGDAGAAGHRRQDDLPARRSRSSCSRRRTRSRWRAPIRCPRRSSTASSSSCSVDVPVARGAAHDPRPHDRRERGARVETVLDAARVCSRCASWCAQVPVARAGAGLRACACSRRRTPTTPSAPRADASKYVRYGASPRGAQALLLAAKIRALLDGRFAVVDRRHPRAWRAPALRHRLILNFEGEAEGVEPDAIIDRDPERPAMSDAARRQAAIERRAAIAELFDERVPRRSSSTSTWSRARCSSGACAPSAARGRPARASSSPTTATTPPATTSATSTGTSTGASTGCCCACSRRKRICTSTSSSTLGARCDRHPRKLRLRRCRSAPRWPTSASPTSTASRSSRSATSVRERLPPARGKGRIFRVFEFLAALRAGGHDRARRRASKTFVHQNKRRGLAVVISDFYDPRASRRGSTCSATTGSSRSCSRSTIARGAAAAARRPRARRLRDRRDARGHGHRRAARARTRASTRSTARSSRASAPARGCRYFRADTAHAVRRAGAAHLPRGRLPVVTFARARRCRSLGAGVRRRRRGAGRARTSSSCGGAASRCRSRAVAARLAREASRRRCGSSCGGCCRCCCS